MRKINETLGDEEVAGGGYCIYSGVFQYHVAIGQRHSQQR